MPHRRDVTTSMIVEAAARLIYADGVTATKVDTVAAEAGVTKKTLYDHFPTKDDLVAAVFDQRCEAVIGFYRAWAHGPADEPVRLKVRRVVEGLCGFVALPSYAGCGFQRAAAEFATRPGHPARRKSAEMKTRVEAWIGEDLGREGWPDAEQKAQQVMLVIEGLLSLSLMHRSPAHAKAALALVDAVLSDGSALAPVGPRAWRGEDQASASTRTQPGDISRSCGRNRAL
jgi:AcrR family transcriptional regulator